MIKHRALTKVSTTAPASWFRRRRIYRSEFEADRFLHMAESLIDLTFSYNAPPRLTWPNAENSESSPQHL
jgi:hypothetical protein